jgi:gliding motility-associated-like protein
MKKIVWILSMVFTCFAYGQGDGIWIHPNKGQWHAPILYKVELNMGEIYLEKKGFTFALNDFKQQMGHDHASSDKTEGQEKSMRSHIIRSTFTGSSWKGDVEESEPSSFYRNYYQGNDPLQWKSNVFSFHIVTMKNFYPGIDLLVEGQSEKLKYSFLLNPQTDARLIEYEIEGAKSLALDKEGNLHIESRFGDMVEEKPIAWNVQEGVQKTVKVEFVLIGNKVHFNFPNGYDTDQMLVIDPSLTFSSFTGSTADNWGMTATPDSQGNLCAGGIVFNDGGAYPTTPGSFDATFNGGDSYIFGGQIPGFDIAISKFNADGTSLLFSTYLGGSANEAPHSLVCGAGDELYIMGVTASPNFPISAGAYDPSFNGGPPITENELYYNGADLFVTKLSANGTALLGSTYIGGSGTDGVNSGVLNFNYGDPFRGEIIDGGNGFIYVTSTTQSTNFPTVSAAQNSLNGIQDAVVFKMNNTLTGMAWCSYYGGNGSESGNSIQLSSGGSVYVVGGTNSTNLTVPSGNDNSFNGGIADGYLTRFNGLTGAILQGTYMGMAEYDQAYFVQLDKNDDVYVFGQTESNWGVSPGLYGTANSGQFIRKYSPNLATIHWTTMIGAGSGHPEISPTAFLVSDCFDIYLSGWGGYINSAHSNQAVNSTTNGFPVTSDAFQTSTNGSNFYIAVLNQDASNLKYATFMGGLNNSYNHVDGGTSRFDKSGRIYHAVCGACGGNNFGFTTTAGVVGPQNLSNNCNLAAFKFELNKIIPIVGQPEPLVCMPDPVIFNNNSSNGNTFYWDFGDGSTSDEVNPTHYYAAPGTYEVQLIVSDSNNCFSSDSLYFELVIGNFEGGVVVPPVPVCPNVPYQLEAYGGAFYSWTPANVLDNASSPTPLATIMETTSFSVIISDSCGADTLALTLQVYNVGVTVSNDTSICIGNDIPLNASGGISYQWTPPTFLNDPVIPNPVSIPDQTISYSLEITTVDNCTVLDTVHISVFHDPPVPIMPDTISMCLHEPALVQVGGGDTYSWSPNYAINTMVGDQVWVNPSDDFTYYCDFFNACGSATDSVFVDVVFPLIIAGTDTTVCPTEPAYLWASGGVSYTWEPANLLVNATGANVIAYAPETMRYRVTGMDQFGCTDTASVQVSLFPVAFVQTCPNVFAFLGDQVPLYATSTTPGSYQWSPPDFLSCTNCLNPIANPDKNYNYTVTYTDENGCSASDRVEINYDGILYVPNSFTPDAEINNLFRPVGGNIDQFKMLIFNRWGEVVCELNSLEKGWNGKYNGLPCQDGTYTWKIIYSDFSHNRKEMVGHVNILR